MNEFEGPGSEYAPHPDDVLDAEGLLVAVGKFIKYSRHAWCFSFIDDEFVIQELEYSGPPVDVLELRGEGYSLQEAMQDMIPNF